MHDQGTDEWRGDRAMCITASRMADLMWEPGHKYKSGKNKGNDKPPPELRSAYIDQIVAEILTGHAIEQVSAKSLAYGKEMEPYAITAYEKRTGALVEQCGFVRSAKHPFIGASPDFLSGLKGGGEIKCPMSIAVHAKTLRLGMPADHIEQVQTGMWATDREWWDFSSYHPKFKDGLDLFVQRIYRDENMISKIEECALSAWDEAQRIVASIRSRLSR